MRKVIFEVDEMRVISVFDTESWEAAIRAVEEVIPMTREDEELSAVVISAAEKLKQISDAGGCGELSAGIHYDNATREKTGRNPKPAGKETAGEVYGQCTEHQRCNRYHKGRCFDSLLCG